MYSSKEKFIEALGVSTMPELFGARFEETMREYEEKGVFFLEESYIDSLQDKYNLFPEKYDFVKKSAKRVRENDLLARYSLLLEHMLRDKNDNELISLTDIPGSDEEPLRTDYEMAAYFAELAFAEDIAEYYRLHNVPKDVICSTLSDCYECCILVCQDCFGRDGFEIARCFAWNQLFINYKMLRVGIFNFEMRCNFTRDISVYQNQEKDYCILVSGDIAFDGQLVGTVGHDTVEYCLNNVENETEYIGYLADTYNAIATPELVYLNKNEWKKVLSFEDSVINVHIPSAVSFSYENMEASYSRCARIVKECFPSFKPKAFACFSWLMDPQLRNMLKPESNILKFQSKYMRFPQITQGKAVHTFLFKKPVDKIEDWGEDTSLQRKVKQHYLNGNYIYEPGGVFFQHIENID